MGGCPLSDHSTVEGLPLRSPSLTAAVPEFVSLSDPGLVLREGQIVSAQVLAVADDGTLEVAIGRLRVRARAQVPLQLGDRFRAEVARERGVMRLRLRPVSSEAPAASSRGENPSSELVAVAGRLLRRLALAFQPRSPAHDGADQEADLLGPRAQGPREVSPGEESPRLNEARPALQNALAPGAFAPSAEGARDPEEREEGEGERPRGGDPGERTHVRIALDFEMLGRVRADLVLCDGGCLLEFAVEGGERASDLRAALPHLEEALRRRGLSMDADVAIAPSAPPPVDGGGEAAPQARGPRLDRSA